MENLQKKKMRCFICDVKETYEWNLYFMVCLSCINNHLLQIYQYGYDNEKIKNYFAKQSEKK
jgi:hypothetical protein